ncbi:MAG: aldo/keto reductase [Planctomycetota bacterium]|nr:aldo/keto reductase [Planctomycetota bacterium]
MKRLGRKTPFGKTGLNVPPIVFGTSCLGNLYEALPWETKLGIMRQWFKWVKPPVALDSAGKYGAGLALETIAKGLRELGIKPEQVVISNKLGWLRTPLRTPEPTFEPGAWVGLEHDAEQRISYEGIMDCWRQGCELLGGYKPQLASVHDPDEYLARAKNAAERAQRFDDVLGAYRALGELKAAGEVQAVGVGSKDWTVIRELAGKTQLDWVMFACSMTVMHHPAELLAFMQKLADSGVGIINSAVFHAGFLTGGQFFDYRKVCADTQEDRPLFDWRDKFLALCRQFNVVPAEACVQFGLSAPGVVAISLNTSKPDRIQSNVASVVAKIPRGFWKAMKEAGLIAREYPGP